MTPDDLYDALLERGLHRNGSKAARVLRVSRQHLWRMLRGERAITDDRAELIQARLAEYDHHPAK